jgi:hypothetical protein
VFSLGRIPVKNHFDEMGYNVCVMVAIKMFLLLKLIINLTDVFFNFKQCDRNTAFEIALNELVFEKVIERCK